MFSFSKIALISCSFSHLLPVKYHEQITGQPKPVKYSLGHKTLLSGKILVEEEREIENSLHFVSFVEMIFNETTGLKIVFYRTADI